MEILSNPEFHKFVLGGGLSVVLFFLIWQVARLMFNFLLKSDTGNNQTTSQLLDLVKTMNGEMRETVDNNTRAMNGLNDHFKTQGIETAAHFRLLGSELKLVGTKVDTLALKVDALAPPPAGLPGPTGATGPTGRTGATGATGPSAPRP
jgi:hypothetical protein